MNAISMKCPACGADFTIEEGRKECFCQFCGTHLYLDDENTHTYVIRDEARLKEAEIHEKESSFELEKEKYLLEKYKKREKLRTIAKIAFIVLLLSFLLFHKLLPKGSYIFTIFFVVELILLYYVLLTHKDDKDKKK